MWKINFAGFLFAFAAVLPVHADQGAADPNYPSRPIRLIVPYAPGGATDKIARVVAEHLSTGFKQSVIVENRPGANNVVGANALLTSKADGYTLMLASNGLLTMAPALFKTLPFNPAKDFTLIGFVNKNPMVLVTRQDAKYGDIGSLMKHAKANPGIVSYAVSGGLVPAMLGAGIQRMSDTQMIEVRYKGSGPSITDIVAGRVDFGIVGVSLAMSLGGESGKLKSIAVTSKERSASLPDVPTLSESGIPEFDTIVWNGLIGPAKLPSNVVARLGQALEALYHDPEYRKTLDASGEEPLLGTPDQMQARINQETALWKKIVAEAKIEPMD